ncbi:hypothetical protein [Pararhodobacter sp.]|uniref:hypothetical protein n=1 Tax=Pararhodobacter sp. TaxID=2127056 RepID=UPI002FE2BEC7
MSRPLRAEIRTQTQIATLILLAALAALPIVAALPARAGGEDAARPAVLPVVPPPAR